MLHTSIHLSNPYVLIYMRYSSRWIYLATNRSLPLHESQWSVNVLDIPGRLQLATKQVPSPSHVKPGKYENHSQK